MSSEPDLEGNYYLPGGILNFSEAHFILQVYYGPDLDSIFRKMQVEYLFLGSFLSTFIWKDRSRIGVLEHVLFYVPFI